MHLFLSEVTFCIHSFHVISELLRHAHLEGKNSTCSPLPFSHLLNIYKFNLVKVPDSCCTIGCINNVYLQLPEECRV